MRYFRGLELPRLARGRDLQHLRPARPRPPDREPALLQRDEPHARGRALPGLRLLWHWASCPTARWRAALLTGKYRPRRYPDKDTRAGRNDKRMMQTEWRPESLQLALQIKQPCRGPRHHRRPVRAVAWVLNSSFVSAVIAGPRTEEQWDDYLRALDYRFTAEDEALIDRLVEQRHPSTPGSNDPAYPIEGRRARTAERQ